MRKPERSNRDKMKRSEERRPTQQGCLLFQDDNSVQFALRAFSLLAPPVVEKNISSDKECRGDARWATATSQQGKRKTRRRVRAYWLGKDVLHYDSGETSAFSNTRSATA